MQSTPNLKDTDPHDVFAIESLLHAHAEKMPQADKAPPLAHDPAAPPAAPPVHVAPPISVGSPGPQVEPNFSAPVARDIKVHSAPVDNAAAGEIKVDALKALDDRPTARWAKRAFMALLGLVGAVAAAGWQHYGDDATAMAAEWTPSFVLAALPGAKPAIAEQPGTPAMDTAATDQTTQPAPAAAAVRPEPAAAAAAAAPAPSAESTQLQSMAHDLAAMGQQVEELKTTIAQLKASQAQMARELAKANEAKTSEAKAPEARAAAVAPPPVAKPAAPPPVRKPKPISSYSPSYSPAPMAAAPAAPPPPMQIAAPPPPPQQTIADDGEPVVRPPMPLR